MPNVIWAGPPANAKQYQWILQRQRTAPPAAVAKAPSRPVLAPVAQPSQPTTVTVAVAAPPQAAPVVVDIRGPDGQVRSFKVAGGAEAIQPRHIIVRAGETVTIQVTAKNP
ncbi:MAG: hypothetical protein NZ700_11050 [Gemmataceae bacterium]|nr:hypothetical protein [Gemmataceae bacterium]MDW8265527.1 hypothetical protein [Gemmataceae bacterium]